MVFPTLVSYTSNTIHCFRPRPSLFATCNLYYWNCYILWFCKIDRKEYMYKLSVNFYYPDLTLEWDIGINDDDDIFESLQNKSN